LNLSSENPVSKFAKIMQLAPLHSGPPKAVTKASVMVREKIAEAQRQSGWVTSTSAKREREAKKLGSVEVRGDGRYGSGRKKEKYGDAAEYNAMYGQ
jgi:hypothetical protein